MLNFPNLVYEKFYSFYQGNESYQFPLEIDLESNLHPYTLIDHRPEVAERIRQVIEPRMAGTMTSLADLLSEDETSFRMRETLTRHRFTILNGTNASTSMTLEHPLTSGWLIKQNFPFGWSGHRRGELVRFCIARRLPFWFFPMRLWSFTNASRGVQTLNAAVNPLRVVMMKRARACIKKFQLTRVEACKEYLFRLPRTADSLPLHKKYVVVSKKAPILSEEDSQRKYIELARENPEELKEIIRQVCLVIKHTHLTDMHINNIRFAAEGSNKVYLFDGEPIGGLSDVSQTEIKNAFKRFDFALFPVLGMRVLQETTANLLREKRWAEGDIKNLQQIFDAAINPAAEAIVSDRRWYYTKIIASFACPIIPLSILVHAVVTTAIAHWNPFARTPLYTEAAS